MTNVSEEEMQEYWMRGHPDDVQCNHCNIIFNWDKLPDENVRIVYESRGQCHGVPCSEPVPYGWTCPSCGKYNSL